MPSVAGYEQSRSISLSQRFSYAVTMYNCLTVGRSGRPLGAVSSRLPRLSPSCSRVVYRRGVIGGEVR